MKKHLFLWMLSATAIFASCSKDKDGTEGLFTPPKQDQLTQTAYADNESTGDGFSFTTDAPWTATVKEVQAKTSQTSVQSKSVTRAEGSNVAWLKLYNGDQEAYSGGAGTITLRIEIEQNYTGQRREATITIRSGNNTFTVTVVQEGTKQDGSQNEPPVKVTKIILDQTELSLEIGATATLTATVEPADATIKSVAWSSSDPAVVTVDEAGALEAVAAGTATITVTATDDESVSASCTVTVSEGQEPDETGAPQLRKLIVTTEEADGTSSTQTCSWTYDDQGRVASYSIVGFDGPETVTTTTYTYETDRITAVYDYTNSQGHGTGGATFELDQNGYALSCRSEYIQDGDAEVYNYEYEYDQDGRLVKAVNGGQQTLLTWTNGNLVATDDYGYNGSREKTVTTYGTEKVLMNMSVIVTGLGSMNIQGIYEDLIPVYGKMGEYLPVEMKSYSWTTPQETEPSEPTETTTYTYEIVDGRLIKAVGTTTDSNGDTIETTTHLFEY